VQISKWSLSAMNKHSKLTSWYKIKRLIFRNYITVKNCLAFERSLYKLNCLMSAHNRATEHTTCETYCVLYWNHLIFQPVTLRCSRKKIAKSDNFVMYGTTLLSLHGFSWNVILGVSTNCEKQIHLWLKSERTLYMGIYRFTACRWIYELKKSAEKAVAKKKN
jgi:hypothetical protein